MRVITRADSDNAGEKCPQCKFIGRSFLEVNDSLWSCMDCGCAFVPKKKRLKIREEISKKQKEVIVEEEKLSVNTEEINPLKCDHPGCDFVAKLPVALAGHKKKHARE